MTTTTAIPTIETLNAQYVQMAYIEAAGNWKIDAERLFVVRKGATVVVARGRKVPQGTTGTVIWTGKSAYGDRVGIATANGTVFTAESNVDVVVDPDDLPIFADYVKQDEIEERAAELALRRLEREQFKAIESTATVVSTARNSWTDDTTYTVEVPEGYSVERYVAWKRAPYNRPSEYNYFGGYSTTGPITTEGRTVRWTRSYHIGN